MGSRAESPACIVVLAAVLAVAVAACGASLPAGSGPATTSPTNATAATASGPVPSSTTSPSASGVATPDDDGITAAIEDAAPARGTSTTGDGNSDGVRDSEQGHVASFPSADGAAYVTLAAPPGARLTSVRATADAPAGLPTGVTLPLGLLSYSLDGVPVGGSVALEVWLPADVKVGAYYKHGPEAARRDPHWYPFGFDGSTGVDWMEGGRFVLRLKDGGRGDDDLEANGRIVDPGGPAWDGNQPPSAAFSVTYAGDHPWALLFDGRASHDPDGSIERVKWIFGDGTEQETGCGTQPCIGLRTQHEYKKDGTYVLGLLVEDDQEGTDYVESDPIPVPEVPLTCELVPDSEGGTEGAAPFNFAFQIQTSWDEVSPGPFGEEVRVFKHVDLVALESMDMGDGTMVTNRFPKSWAPDYSHVYRKPGTYRALAQVDVINPATKIVGATARCERLVRALPPPGAITGSVTWRTQQRTTTEDSELQDSLTITINVVARVVEDEEGVSYEDAGSSYTVSGSHSNVSHDRALGCTVRVEQTSSGSGGFDRPGSEFNVSLTEAYEDEPAEVFIGARVVFRTTGKTTVTCPVSGTQTSPIDIPDDSASIECEETAGLRGKATDAAGTSFRIDCRVAGAARTTEATGTLTVGR